MIINVSPEIRKEVTEQLWADQAHLGINHEEIIYEWLKETFGMETEELYLE